MVLAAPGGFECNGILGRDQTGADGLVFVILGSGASLLGAAVPAVLLFSSGCFPARSPNLLCLDLSGSGRIQCPARGVSPNQSASPLHVSPRVPKPWSPNGNRSSLWSSVHIPMAKHCLGVSTSPFSNPGPLSAPSTAIGIGFYGNSETNDGVYQLLYALDNANHTLTGIDTLVGL